VAPRFLMNRGATPACHNAPQPLLAVQSCASSGFISVNTTGTFSISAEAPRGPRTTRRSWCAAQRSQNRGQLACLSGQLQAGAQGPDLLELEGRFPPDQFAPVPGDARGYARGCKCIHCLSPLWLVRRQKLRPCSAARFRRIRADSQTRPSGRSGPVGGRSAGVLGAPGVGHHQTLDTYSRTAPQRRTTGATRCIRQTSLPRLERPRQWTRPTRTRRLAGNRSAGHAARLSATHLWGQVPGTKPANRPC
jgi:hypothetical protein